MYYVFFQIENLITAIEQSRFTQLRKISCANVLARLIIYPISLLYIYKNSCYCFLQKDNFVIVTLNHSNSQLLDVDISKDQ